MTEILTEPQFKEKCIVAENANYYYVFTLDHDLVRGQCRIPKHRAIGQISQDWAISEAYEWYLDGCAEMEYEKMAPAPPEAKELREPIRRPGGCNSEDGCDCVQCRPELYKKES